MFCWFLSPSFGDHEWTYFCALLSFVWKWNKTNSLWTSALYRNCIKLLQVEHCQVKITSWVQYLNGNQLHSCPHQANCVACAPVNVAVILNELLKETYNINSLYTMNSQILPLYVLIDPWLHCPTEKLLTCSISHALLFGQVWRIYLL